MSGDGVDGRCANTIDVPTIERIATRTVVGFMAALYITAFGHNRFVVRREPAILVSRQLLAKAHLSVGDVVTLAADANGTRARQFRIAGVYEPTPDPMKFNVERLETRLHLDDLLGLVADPSDPSAADAVSAINVALSDPSKGT